MKTFIVKSIDGEDGTLQCPRRDCKGKFTVNRKKFKEAKYTARPCPYCFRVSGVPGK